jgi:hexosaminidase
MQSVVFGILSLTVFLPAQAQSTLNLMPLPVKAESAPGQLVIDDSLTVKIEGPNDSRVRKAVDRFFASLRLQTGIPFAGRLASDSSAKFVIRVAEKSKDVPELGEDESYNLEITDGAGVLNAPNSLGALHGLQTFLQLVKVTSSGFAVPAVSIEDHPRFPWRGLLLDLGRRFMPVDALKRNLDAMAAVKMNVLHLHLTENLGFRMESKRFPKLHEQGSQGSYYTQAEMRDLIRYAADRGIRMVPEFDMPGHSVSWLVGYPEISSTPGPFRVAEHWGILDPTMDPSKEKTYEFLNEFIDEMASIFPDRYFHIGGDEVNGKAWDGSRQIQEFKRAHNFQSNAELQAYFNRRVQAMIQKHGKIMMGWDEILDPNLPKDIVIHSWRGQASLVQSVQQGFSALHSFGYYLDVDQSAAQHYASDPMTGPSTSLTPEEAKRILGGESCMWTEYVSTEMYDSHIWPRTAAIAERLWSPQSVTDVDSMYTRLDAITRQLDEYGLTQNSTYDWMLQRIAGSRDVSAMRTLADVLQPVNEDDRYKFDGNTVVSTTPLNRLIDAVRPESRTARRFTQLVDRFNAGETNPENEIHIRSWLMRWRDNDSILQPATAESFLLKATTDASQNLSKVANVGLVALDYRSRKQRPPEGWLEQQRSLLQEAQKPTAGVLLMIVPPVQKLVEAVAK